MAKRKTAQEVLGWIENRIAEGRTVYIATALNITEITPKNFKRWSDSGSDLFKVSKNGDELFIAKGKKYECVWSKAFGCQFTAR